MTIKDLIFAFEVSQNQLEHFMEGITSEQANQQTCGDGNPVNWILGHILSERIEALETISAEALDIHLSDFQMYVTGSNPDPNSFLDYDSLLALIPKTFVLLTDTIKSLSIEKLDEIQEGTLLGKQHTLRQALITYALHEMYHIGQISVARQGSE